MVDYDKTVTEIKKVDSEILELLKNDFDDEYPYERLAVDEDENTVLKIITMAENRAYMYHLIDDVITPEMPVLEVIEVVCDEVHFESDMEGKSLVDKVIIMALEYAEEYGTLDNYFDIDS